MSNGRGEDTLAKYVDVNTITMLWLTTNTNGRPGRARHRQHQWPWLSLAYHVNKRYVDDLGRVSADLVSGSSAKMTGDHTPLKRGRKCTLLRSMCFACLYCS